MLPALTALVVLLTIATAANFLLTSALARRLRTVELAGARPARRPPAGTRVSDFAARSVSGRAIERADLLGGERLAVFLQVGCGPCGDLIADLAGNAAAGGFPTYFFVSGDPSDTKTREMAGRLSGLGEVALVGTGPEVGAAFGGIDVFPTLLVLRDAVVTASGHDLAGTLPDRPGEAGRGDRVPAHAADGR